MQPSIEIQEELFTALVHALNAGISAIALCKSIVSVVFDLEKATPEERERVLRESVDAVRARG